VIFFWKMDPSSTGTTPTSSSSSNINMNMNTAGTYDASADLQRELSGGQRCMKGTLIIQNIIFLIFGIVLCAVGASALNNQVNAIVGATLPNGIIAVGVFIILLSLMGFLSAWLESRLGLQIYFGFVLVLALILIAIGVAVYIAQSNSNTFVAQAWTSSGPDVKQSLQNVFGCCGLVTWNDSALPCPSGLIPPPPTTVAPPVTATTANTTRPPTPIYGPTCQIAMVNAFQSSYSIAGACGIAFAVLMFGSLFFIQVLRRGIQNTNYARQIDLNREKNRTRKNKQK